MRQPGDADSNLRTAVMHGLAVQRRLADRGELPGEDEAELLTLSWSQTLQPVPTDSLNAMYMAAEQYNAEQYFARRAPTPHEVLAAWRRYQASQPIKTFQQEEAARRPSLPSGDDGACHQSAMRVRLRLHEGKGVPVCGCQHERDGSRLTAMQTPDCRWWICEHNKCSFKWPDEDIENAPFDTSAGPLGGLTATAVPEQKHLDPFVLNDAELLRALKEKAKFCADKIPYPKAVEFAHDLIRHLAWDNITQDTARDHWLEWDQRHQRPAA